MTPSETAFIEPVKTQREVAAEMGLSRARVHQIEKRALAKLRKWDQIQEEADRAGLTPREWLAGE